MRRISKFGRRVVAAQPCRSLVESLESRTLLNAADLDATFGTGGIATAQFNGYGQSGAQAMTLQSDGKMIAAGYSASSSIQTWAAVARYNTDGSLDTTFGTGGTMQLGVGIYAQFNAVAIQSDGKIVLAGQTQPNANSTQFLVARLNTNGTLDTTFNSNGYEAFNVNQSRDVANAVAIQSDGKIVVVGQDSGSVSNFALARLNANGTLDGTFGTGGLVTTNINNNNSTASACNAIAVDSNDNIDAAGAIGVDKYSDTVMGYIQYSSSGQVNFVAKEAVGDFSSAGTSVALQSDGAVVVAGGANNLFAAVRFNPSGSIDTTFANSGVFQYTTTQGTWDSVNLMSNGDVVLAGRLYALNPSGIVTRLTPSGALDTTFNSTGSVLFGTEFVVYASAVRSSGAIVVAGTTNPPNDMTVQQFTTTGAADTTFGSGAPISTDFIDPVQTVGRSAALQPDGKLVVGSVYYHSATAGRQQQAAITRFNVDGTIDTTFGDNGSVLITAGYLTDLVGVVVQPDGDIVMAGTTESLHFTPVSVILERFLPTGALDTSFGVGGQVSLDATDGYNQDNAAAGLVMTPDGSLIVLGITDAAAGSTITKLRPDGQFDTSYGTAGTGIITTGVAWKTEALDAYGRLQVAAGSYTARYNANGTLDPTFQQSSIITFSSASSIIPQPDGKVLISGVNGPSLQRYTSSGAPDVTFGTNGLATLGTGNFVGAGTLLGNGDILAGGYQYTLNGNVGLICAFNSYGMPITTFGTGGMGLYSALSANNALVLRSNGRVLIIGQTTDGKEGVVQIMGNMPNVIQATPGDETINLSRSGDGQSINWTLGATNGSILASDPAGLTINGDAADDTITLAGNNALPTILHLNGTFTINGLTGTDPLANSAMDINASTLFITYAGPAADPFSNIRADIKTGFHNGLWNGVQTVATGVLGSAAAEGNAVHNTAIGYADSADGLVVLPAKTIELKYTLYGDTGLTGSVGFTDFMRMTQHYTLTGQTWGKGDFNYDGSVDSADFNLLQPNYGQTLPAPAPAMTPVFATPVAATAPSRVTVDPLPTSSTDDSTDRTVSPAKSSSSNKAKKRAAKVARKHS